MCGRYASSRKPEDLVEEFGVDRVDVAEPLEPDYNVAPTKDVYAVFDRVPRGAGAEAEPAAPAGVGVVGAGARPGPRTGRSARG